MYCIQTEIWKVDKDVVKLPQRVGQQIPPRVVKVDDALEFFLGTG